MVGRERLIAVYAGCVTVVLVAALVCGFAEVRKAREFDVITAHRVNIVEPDGTMRMMISNKASAPGLYIKNKEYPHETRHTAGLIFLDDEGTEDGGLIYGLEKGEGGSVESNVHLSFDKYRQDQIFTVDAGREDGKDYSELTMQDRGDYPIEEAMEAEHRIAKLPGAEQKEAWTKFGETHRGDEKRVVLGRAKDGAAELRLKDAEGRDRIVMRVEGDGAAKVEILGADGKVIDELPGRK